MKREQLPAPLRPRPLRFVAMRLEHLDAVMAIEHCAYPVPWTRGNFLDSLAAGCLATCLFDDGPQLLAYIVAMRGAGEMHLLNLTVAPGVQRRGHARRLLDHLLAASSDDGADQVWLEVRAGNRRAREIYRRYGFVEVGLRKAYYPAATQAAQCEREDAITMSLRLERGAA